MNEYVNIPIEEHDFPQVYIDLTFKCNMKCNTCYNPLEKRPDMDLDYFEEACKRMKRKVWFRFIGGEPTINQNRLFKAMKIAKKYNHLVSIVTNGIRFADMKFTQALKDLKIPVVIALSFDGGLNDDYYEEINSQRCLQTKLKALDNMEAAHYNRVVLCTTLVRGLNEDAIPQVLDVAEKYNCVKYIHYRSQLHLSNWVKEKAYNLKEIDELVGSYLPEWKNPYRLIRDGVHAPPGKKCRYCCKCAWVKPNLQIALIDTSSDGIRKCHMRGKLNDDFTLTSFFESMYQACEEFNDEGVEYARTGTGP